MSGIDGLAILPDRYSSANYGQWLFEQLRNTFTQEEKQLVDVDVTSATANENAVTITREFDNGWQISTYEDYSSNQSATETLRIPVAFDDATYYLEAHKNMEQDRASYQFILDSGAATIIGTNASLPTAIASSLENTDEVFELCQLKYALWAILGKEPSVAYQAAAKIIHNPIDHSTEYRAASSYIRLDG